MSSTPGETSSPRQPDRQAILRDIQGGVIGFNKDNVRMVFLNLSDAQSGKALIAELLPHVATGHDVLEFNALFGDIAKRGGDPGATIEARWVNVLLTKSGLQELGAVGLETLPEEFQQTMAGRSQLLGDTGRSAPDQWVAPFTGGAEPQVVVLIGADTPDGAEARVVWVQQIASSHGASVVGVQVGQARPSPNQSHEHFGFRDGIAQPGIEKLTKSSKTGSIRLGEILIGYEDADGHVSGQPSTSAPPPASPYDPTPAPATQALPPWMHNASMVAYRRLRQDVVSFQNAMNADAGSVGLSPDQLAAKLLGRWPSGAPMERVPGMPKGMNPALADPSTNGFSEALENSKIDKFDYHDDPDGVRVPRAAHIRKVNPRADALADGDHSRRHRMVRRGITYGPEVGPGEPVYGGGTVPDNQDRGLLFLGFQSSIARGFEFVQSRWSNRDDFQQPGDGQDPVTAQDRDQRLFNIPGHGQMNFAPWVFTTGGAYLVSLSVSGLKSLVVA